ncbi:unnamed protein product [Tilletia caries]|uniref:Electron transfer flavoprotein-ubiquinone oxidoreductase n=1 Tax=Tilletia caries TaxID=13290 RepID=A0ABN7J5K1_9BASI|nr:unnamed protein product [Tilletia caries]CAD6953744.1 unnamed protein product [Tilletia caries]CAD6967761.1 unnamed protein product [Tilletia controversa]CAD7063918.1 unnamed protein product [Tilletia caries]
MADLIVLGGVSAGLSAVIKFRQPAEVEGKELRVVREVWKAKPEKHQPGMFQHTLGWPLDFKTYGGSWLYHREDNMISIGLVVGPDYENPYLNPFREFQRMMHHPMVAKLLEDGGALIGCSAGFLNVPRIKSTHSAAAEAAFERLSKRNEAVTDAEAVGDLEDIASYKAKLDNVDSRILKGRTPWTFHIEHQDHETFKLAAESKQIESPKPDGKISLDILTSVARTGTIHAENQPGHLRVKNVDMAGYMEYNVGKYQLANCIHCKTCSVVTQDQSIEWCTTEGGEVSRTPSPD